MEFHTLLLKLLLASYFFVSVVCWDSEDMEIFDLVEEVNVNFYQLLQVPEDTNSTEIKKAFRKLSLNTHPDKSDAPDAEIKFRQLAAVYEVLKDPNKRAKYDLVLKNGLPNWHEAVYYYRRVRKMGLAEMMAILFIIVTLGQYIVSWAAYFEKKYVAEQFMSSRLKKMQKKNKKAKPEVILPVEPTVEIPSPSVYDVLPLQIIRLVWFCVCALPSCYGMVHGYLEEWQRKAEDEEVMDEEEDGEEGNKKRVRRRKVFELPEVKECGLDEESDHEEKPVVSPVAPVSGGLWTDDDLADLVKQIKRYPPGTMDRWDKIGFALNRSVPEVTFMARKIKEEGYRASIVSSATNGLADVEREEFHPEKPRKVKTKGGKKLQPEEELSNEEGPLVVNSESEVVWSQYEQKALENALIKYPKGSSDRWDKIAKCVVGKSKEECVLRYKILVEMVKKRKESQEKQSVEAKVDEL